MKSKSMERCDKHFKHFFLWRSEINGIDLNVEQYIFFCRLLTMGLIVRSLSDVFRPIPSILSRYDRKPLHCILYNCMFVEVKK